MTALTPLMLRSSPSPEWFCRKTVEIPQCPWPWGQTNTSHQPPYDRDKCLHSWQCGWRSIRATRDGNESAVTVTKPNYKQDCSQVSCNSRYLSGVFLHHRSLTERHLDSVADSTSSMTLQRLKKSRWDWSRWPSVSGTSSSIIWPGGALKSPNTLYKSQTNSCKRNANRQTLTLHRISYRWCREQESRWGQFEQTLRWFIGSGRASTL